jgi:hypothetical protein
VAPRGAVGQQIFDEVERLTAGGMMKRSAAFKQIAESSGRSAGTVAANNDRVARQKGVGLRVRRARTRSAAGVTCPPPLAHSLCESRP